MSDIDEVLYCKHNVRVFEDCPECENDAEIALQADTAKYVMKLKRQLAEANTLIARLQAECRAWSAWCDAQRGGKVVPVKGHAARAAVDANNDLGEQSDHPVNEGAD